MITKWYKNALAMFLCSESTTLLPALNVSGATRYLSGNVNSTFPQSRSTSLSLSTSSSGIVLGTGNTAPTENDYALESMITSGLSQVGTASTSSFFDSQNNPCGSVILTVQNTSSDDITIREVGSIQSFRANSTQGSSSSVTTTRFLIDRTVLESPITIEAGGVAAIKYILKTVVNAT